MINIIIITIMTMISITNYIVHRYIYIYIERERDVHYIYIYIERERDVHTYYGYTHNRRAAHIMDTPPEQKLSEFLLEKTLWVKKEKKKLWMHA